MAERCRLGIGVMRSFWRYMLQAAHPGFSGSPGAILSERARKTASEATFSEVR
jgi:hypothetical protein